MNHSLIWNYTKEEVEATFKNMGPLKSLGPNGFGVSFYQKHWNIVGDNMCATMLNILDGDGMVSPFNSTLIALIPKKINPSVVNKF